MYLNQISENGETEEMGYSEPNEEHSFGEDEEDVTTQREADIQNKILYIQGALQKLRNNFPNF